MRLTSSTPDASAQNFTSAYSKRPSTSTSKPTDEFEYPDYVLPTLAPDPCTLFWDDGCLRVGFNPFTVEIAVVLLLTLFHVSMITFLVLRGKREPAFREAFYVQFMTASIVDCLRMALLICDKLNDAANTLYAMYSPVVRHVSYVVPTYAQSMLHLLIAINRLTAFFYPLDHSTIWSNRVTATTIAVAVALSILLHFAPFYLLPLFYTGSMFCMECNDEKWDPLIGYQAQLDNALNAVACLLCAISGFVISITTIAKLRTLARSGQLRQTSFGRDLKLLVHSTFMISMQIFLTLPIFVNTIRTIPLGFSDDGIFFTDAWNPWFEPFHAFSLYVTEERLAEVLSLSGTPFLLLISNHVRSAYCQFYFKCLSGKPAKTAVQQSGQSRSGNSSTLFARRNN